MGRSAVKPIPFAVALVAALLATPRAPRADDLADALKGLKGDSKGRPACRLLSVAEVQQITGNAEYKESPFGDDPGEGAGGGSSCNYGGPTLMGSGPPQVSVVLIPPGKGERYFDFRHEGKLAPGCKREPVSGVGKDAFFESCPRQSELPLFVKGPGADDLVVAMKTDGKDADPAAMKKTIVALAKAAAAKLK